MKCDKFSLSFRAEHSHAHSRERASARGTDTFDVYDLFQTNAGQRALQ